ncbi:hypothetical protein EZV62_009316 [Acer yangbiense]|uniref:Amino acid transporter transmembrane domain-containing protein n=1 Tax=Acer yangbiense TaxID=1000413 RepID=A0A5C7IFZ2_9ROSI|nr:hypothetical protein EZV62_009316 [Acer yangbiense]
MAVEHSLELHNGSSSSSCDDDGHPRRTGTLWSCIAHTINEVIGSGVLSLAWSTAQLGWIAGPVSLLCFAIFTYVSAFLLADCYRSPDSITGTRNCSYMDAVRVNLGKTRSWFCGLLQNLSFYLTGVAYVITTSTCMRAIQKSNCYHREGHEAPCAYGYTFYMLLFGAVQIVMSQIPNFHDMEWLSVIAAIMSFTYSFIGFGLGFAKVIENEEIKGSISGIPTANTADKLWLAFQALGDIAFAYPYSIILLEIQPLDLTPGNLLTGFGFYEPYWLIDFANACIVLHLVGGYQLYSQPVFGFVERWLTRKYPTSGFVNNFYTFKLPSLPPLKINLLRITFRTAYVVSTTAIAMIFPYFNQVLGVLGALNFWPMAIYFPVELYFVQKKIGAWTKKWIVLRIFSFICLLVTIIGLIGSIEGLISAKLG